MVEMALRWLLLSQRDRGTILAPRRFRSGGTLLDGVDRNALYRAMEGPVMLAVDSRSAVCGLGSRRDVQGNELRLTSAIPAHQSPTQVPPERPDTSGSCTSRESSCHGMQLPESVHGSQSVFVNLDSLPWRRGIEVVAARAIGQNLARMRETKNDLWRKL
jgi:hypothetical protein